MWRSAPAGPGGSPRSRDAGRRAPPGGRRSGRADRRPRAERPPGVRVRTEVLRPRPGPGCRPSVRGCCDRGERRPVCGDSSGPGRPVRRRSARSSRSETRCHGYRLGLSSTARTVPRSPCRSPPPVRLRLPGGSARHCSGQGRRAVEARTYCGAVCGAVRGCTVGVGRGAWRRARGRESATRVAGPGRGCDRSRRVRCLGTAAGVGRVLRGRGSGRRTPDPAGGRVAARPGAAGTPAAGLGSARPAGRRWQCGAGPGPGGRPPERLRCPRLRRPGWPGRSPEVDTGRPEAGGRGERRGGGRRRGLDRGAARHGQPRGVDTAG